MYKVTLGDLSVLYVIICAIRLTAGCLLRKLDECEREREREREREDNKKFQTKKQRVVYTEY